MIRRRRRRCRHCNELFLPDAGNRTRQRYCAKPVKKRVNVNGLIRESGFYFRDPVHVERVRQWRAKHPGYARIKKKALQDPSCENTNKKRGVQPTLTTEPLQGPLLAQRLVLIGLLTSQLAMDVAQAREELVRIGLIAYREPIYQVLSLEPEVVGHD